jgi:hypothetical protein
MSHLMYTLIFSQQPKKFKLRKFLQRERYAQLYIIEEHVLALHDLTMLDSAVSSVQHQITLRWLTLKNMYYLCMI